MRVHQQPRGRGAITLGLSPPVSPIAKPRARTKCCAPASLSYPLFEFRRAAGSFWHSGFCTHPLITTDVSESFAHPLEAMRHLGLLLPQSSHRQRTAAPPAGLASVRQPQNCVADADYASGSGCLADAVLLDECRKSTWTHVVRMKMVNFRSRFRRRAQP